MNETKEKQGIDLNDFWDETKLDQDFVNSLTIADRVATIIDIITVNITDDNGEVKVLPQFTLDFNKKSVMKNFLLNKTSKDNLREGFGTTIAKDMIGQQVFPTVKTFGKHQGIVLHPIIRGGD